METRTRIVARNSADEFAALLVLPRYGSEIVLDRSTGPTTVLVERVYLRGSL